MENWQELRSLQRQYLLAFLFLAIGDRFQVPYEYRLYSKLGFDTDAIGIIFSAGFLSLCVMQLIVCKISSKLGKKNTAIIGTILYLISALLKQKTTLKLMIFSRVLSGAAVAFIFTLTESWFSDHMSAAGHLAEKWIQRTSTVASMCFGVLSIAAGIIGAVITDMFLLRISVLYIYAAVFLSLAVTTMVFLWPGDFQNFEKTDEAKPLFLPANTEERKAMLYFCIIEAAFELVTCIFEVLWTPMCESSMIEIGIVFAVLSLSSVLGSLFFKMIHNNSPNPKFVICLSVILSFFALIFCVLGTQARRHPFILNLMALMAFYFAWGLRLPAHHHLKNMFLFRGRVSLLTWSHVVARGIAIALVLFYHTDLPTDHCVIFKTCSAILLVALIASAKINFNFPESKLVAQT